MNIANGITTSVVNYTVIIEHIINITVEFKDACSSFSCMYDYKIPNKMSQMDYSVYVVAENQLPNGYSEKQMCTDRIHSKKLIVKIICPIII